MLELLHDLMIPPIPAWNQLHPLVIHFPIALLMTAPVFLVLGLIFRRARQAMLWSALILTALGTLSVYVSIETGEAAAQSVSHAGPIHEVLETHEELAEATLTVFLVLTGLQAFLMVVQWAWRKLRPENPAPAPATAAAGSSPAPAPQKCGKGSAIIWLIYLVLYVVGVFMLINTAHRGGLLVHQYGVRSLVPMEPSPTTSSAPAAQEHEH